MIRGHGHKGKRSAFTLVELLVVILIIAILVSLVSSAVMMAMNKIPEVKTRTEISEMAVALQAFMSDYNISDPPPSYLVLYEQPIQYTTPPYSTVPGAAQSYTFLQKVFGKNLGPSDWNGDLTVNPPTSPPWVLLGHQALIFYLGGIPNTAAMAGGAPPGPQGFSTNNMSPGLAGGKRKGPYFTFDPTRLRATPSMGFFVYIDPWQTKTGPFYPVLGGTPYVYFSSNGLNNAYSTTDCSLLTFSDTLGSHFPMPYWTAQTASAPPIPTQYTNSNSYQIISAGKDGKFGYNPAFLPAPNNLWAPASGAVGTGADDQANFSSSLLGSGQS